MTDIRKQAGLFSYGAGLKATVVVSIFTEWACFPENGRKHTRLSLLCSRSEGNSSSRLDLHSTAIESRALAIVVTMATGAHPLQICMC